MFIPDAAAIAIRVSAFKRFSVKVYPQWLTHQTYFGSAPQTLPENTKLAPDDPLAVV